LKKVIDRDIIDGKNREVNIPGKIGGKKIKILVDNGGKWL
jgi:hypothetical protein